MNSDLLREFHRAWYGANVWQRVRWRGGALCKCPMDLLVLAEVLHEVRPDVVVECGTYDGASAVYMADMLRIAHGDDRARVVTIDVDRKERSLPTNVVQLVGSSIDPTIVAEVRRLVPEGSRVLVDLDSDHSTAHVARELDAYAPLVSVGSYLIVEDTNVDAVLGWSDGPAAAVSQFLTAHPEFEVDANRERLMLTFNPGGWLRRTR